jgi:hypothetical protein
MLLTWENINIKIKADLGLQVSNDICLDVNVGHIKLYQHGKKSKSANHNINKQLII